MNCTTCSEFIYDYLDNDVDKQTQCELEIHLAECEACRLELMEVKEGMNIYHNWVTSVELSTEFTAEVLIQLSDTKTVSAYPIFRIVGVSLISILAMLAFFVAPVLYSLGTVAFDLFVNILPLPGIFLAEFPVAQTTSLAILGTMLAGMTWAMRHAIEL